MLWNSLFGIEGVRALILKLAMHCNHLGIVGVCLLVCLFVSPGEFLNLMLDPATIVSGLISISSSLNWASVVLKILQVIIIF